MFKIIQGLFYTIPFSCSGMLVYSRLRKPKNIGNLLFTFRMELIKKHLTLFSCSIIISASTSIPTVYKAGLCS